MVVDGNPKLKSDVKAWELELWIKAVIQWLRFSCHSGPDFNL